MLAASQADQNASPGEAHLMRCLLELQVENRVLVRSLGAIQRRITALTTLQRREMEALQATVMRLRGELISRDTLVAMLRQELARVEALLPRAALAA